MKIALRFNTKDKSKTNLLFLALWSGSALLPLGFNVVRRLPVIGAGADLIQTIGMPRYLTGLAVNLPDMTEPDAKARRDRASQKPVFPRR